MNKRQRYLKRKYLAEEKHREVSPTIDCLLCDDCQVDEGDAGLTFLSVYRCRLLCEVLYKSEGGESLDGLNAPARCPKRKQLESWSVLHDARKGRRELEFMKRVIIKENPK
jgi:hypothetical protein